MFVICFPGYTSQVREWTGTTTMSTKLVFVKQASLISSEIALRGQKGDRNVEPVVVSYGFLKNNSHPSSHEAYQFPVFCLWHAGVKSAAQWSRPRLSLQMLNASMLPRSLQSDALLSVT